jgi:hypothetical protein
MYMSVVTHLRSKPSRMARRNGGRMQRELAWEVEPEKSSGGEGQMLPGFAMLLQRKGAVGWPKLSLGPGRNEFTRKAPLHGAVKREEPLTADIVGAAAPRAAREMSERGALATYSERTGEGFLRNGNRRHVKRRGGAGVWDARQSLWALCKASGSGRACDGWTTGWPSHA